MMALVAAIFTACENQGDENDTRDDFTLVRTSASVMDFTAEGGDGEITYTLESTRVEAKPTVTATFADDWITNIVSTDDNRITFTVLPNEGAARSGLMTVSCGDQNFKVMIQQVSPSAIDKRFTATHLGGVYYGKYISDKGVTAYNYYVILSDMQPRAVSNPPYGATEYRFDIYSDVCGEFVRPQELPVGVYTIDHTSSGKVGSIDGKKDCSYLFDDSEGNYAVMGYSLATLTVTEDSIVADITMLSGQVHRVEYHGSRVFEKFSETTYADISPVSNHTSDVLFDIKGGDIMAYYRGDWFSSNNDVWFLHMIETRSPSFSGVYLLMNLIVPKSLGGFSNPTGFYGEYTLTDPTAESWDYTYPAGRLREDSTQLNAWYMHFGDELVDMVPIKGGTIKVEGDGSVNCTITVDGIDDRGNKVIGTFSGIVSDRQDQSGK